MKHLGICIYIWVVLIAYQAAQKHRRKNRLGPTANEGRGLPLIAVWGI